MLKFHCLLKQHLNSGESKEGVFESGPCVYCSSQLFGRLKKHTEEGKGVARELLLLAANWVGWWAREAVSGGSIRGLLSTRCGHLSAPGHRQPAMSPARPRASTRLLLHVTDLIIPSGDVRPWNNPMSAPRYIHW